MSYKNNYGTTWNLPKYIENDFRIQVDQEDKTKYNLRITYIVYKDEATHSISLNDDSITGERISIELKDIDTKKSINDLRTKTLNTL